MVKFGMPTNPTIDILKEIRTIAKLGFDYAEIGIEGPEGKPEVLLEKRNEILELLKKKNLFAIGHTSWWVELGTEYEPVRKGWLEECKKAIRISNKLNLPIINLHSTVFGMYLEDDRYRNIVINNWIKSLREIVEYGKKFNVNIILENMPEGYGITDLKDFKYIINSSGAGVHLDIAHAFTKGRMKNVKEYIGTFKGRIEHIHVSDNFGKRDDHLPIGKGKINFVKVVKMLKKINYDKTMTFEVFTSKKDAMKSREKIKKLWNRY